MLQQVLWRETIVCKSKTFDIQSKQLHMKLRRKKALFRGFSAFTMVFSLDECLLPKRRFETLHYFLETQQFLAALY